MKKLVLLFALISFASFSSCKRKRNCTCTETYSGAETNYTNIKDSTITGLTKDEAAAICDQGDKASQTILTETYEIDCELN